MLKQAFTDLCETEKEDGILVHREVALNQSWTLEGFVSNCLTEHTLLSQTAAVRVTPVPQN